MVKGDKIRADRTPWPDELTKTFIEICIEEKRAGNMDGNHLNSFGKAQLLQKFNQRTNKGYDEGQLSRKWSTQKALWVAWQKLLMCATGLGRTANGTVSAPEDWWIDKIKLDKKYRTFRYAPLQYKELHEELFADVVATGKYARTPRSYLVPPNSGNHEGEYDNLPDMPPEMAPQMQPDMAPDTADAMDSHSSNHSGDEGPSPAAPATTPPPAAPAPPAEPAVNMRRSQGGPSSWGIGPTSGRPTRGKRAAAAQLPRRQRIDSLDELNMSDMDLITDMRGRAPPPPPPPPESVTVNSPCNQEKVVDILLAMPGMVAGSQIFNQSIRVLKIPENEKYFLVMHGKISQDQLLSWLLDEVNEFQYRRGLANMTA